MTAVLVSCQGAILNIRFVSVEGPWVELVHAPFQSTAFHHCFGTEAGQLRIAGEVSAGEGKENKKATCFSGSYRIGTDGIHQNSHFLL